MFFTDEKTLENSTEVGENNSLSPCSVQDEPNDNEESDNEPPEVQPIVKCKRYTFWYRTTAPVLPTFHPISKKTRTHLKSLHLKKSPGHTSSALQATFPSGWPRCHLMTSSSSEPSWQSWTPLHQSRDLDTHLRPSEHLNSDLRHSSTAAETHRGETTHRVMTHSKGSLPILTDIC